MRYKIVNRQQHFRTDFIEEETYFVPEAEPMRYKIVVRQQYICTDFV